MEFFGVQVGGYDSVECTTLKTKLLVKFSESVAKVGGRIDFESIEYHVFKDVLSLIAYSIDSRQPTVLTDWSKYHKKYMGKTVPNVFSHWDIALTVLTILAKGKESVKDSEVKETYNQIALNVKASFKAFNGEDELVSSSRPEYGATWKQMLANLEVVVDHKNEAISQITSPTELLSAIDAQGDKSNQIETGAVNDSRDEGETEIDFSKV